MPDQFLAPFTSCPPLLTTGLTAVTFLAPLAINSQSLTLSDCTLLEPMLTPPRLWLARITIMRLVPMSESWLAVLCFSPSPKLTTAMTAAMPMTIPSMESAERVLLRSRAFTEILMRFSISMSIVVFYGQSCEGFSR